MTSFNVYGNFCSSINNAVLIPSFNDNQGLIRTLDSLSDNVKFNVLIVDDGSIEKVSDNIDFSSYDFNVKIIELSCNSGIIVALNSGLKYLSSLNVGYVFRLDACDLHIHGRFEKQLKLMKEKNAALVGGSVIYIDEDGYVINELSLPLDSKDIKRYQPLRSCFVHPGVLINIGLLEENKFNYLYDVRYIHAEDYALFSAITKKFNVANTNENVVKCLVRNEGISLSNRRKQIKSVLKAQCDYFTVSNVFCFIGIVKTIILLILPRELVELLKSKLFKIYR